jgi:hypothetical protein
VSEPQTPSPLIRPADPDFGGLKGEKVKSKTVAWKAIVNRI